MRLIPYHFIETAHVDADEARGLSSLQVLISYAFSAITEYNIRTLYDKLVKITY